jgi:hypothetical protein
MGATLSKFRLECLVVSGEEEAQTISKFLIQALWDVALLLQVKCDYPQENNIDYIFRIEQWKELFSLFKNFITYFKIHSDFPNPSLL